tara:strand:- start:3341 stop:3784 length:444 start_codon:yes stop_codon:yes gene_type:complete
MFPNIHLYIIIGLLGSITPLFDRLNLKKLSWYTYLFFREIIFLLCLGFIILYNQENIYQNFIKLNTKEKNILVLGSIISFIYVSLIIRTFQLEFTDQSISKVVNVMIILTIIFTFLIDRFYLNNKFSNINYLGIIFLILGIYFLKIV